MADDAIKQALSFKERNSETMVSFGFRLRNQFSMNKAYRRAKELEWLESLRQYKGIYDPDVRLEVNASKVYPKITRSKVNIVLSRLHEMLFPENDKNWEIIPTPEPRLTKEIVKQIAMSLITINPETNEPLLPSTKDLHLAIKAFAKTTCEKMSSVINDQLIEMDYSEETKKVIRSALMYGTGIMKGPLVGKRQKRRWQPTEDGLDYEEAVEDEEVPDLQFVRIWDWYPDMSVVEVDKMTGSFERHIMNKHDLRQLMKRPDFYPEMIRVYIEDRPDGDYVPNNWEVDLQVIEIEAGSGQHGQVSSTSVSGETYESGRSTNRQLGKKYEVLEFWGYVDGHDLETCGLDIPDVSLEYAANVWLLGNRPIKVLLYPTAIDQYKIFYYEKDETSIFGESLARIMRHSQIAIAGAARMVLDNSACVAGPQVEVNWNLMTPDTDVSSFYPRKIWYREGRGIDAQYPAIRVYNIDSHIDELLKVVNAFKQFGDEETTLPTWMIGQQINETAQATSGRLATITVSIKDVVKNFDAFTEKILRDIYAWNMDFNPRQDIKGDFLCRARGISSLVMKEIRMQALTQLSTTLTDSERDYVPEGEFVKEKFKAHDLSIVLRTEEEVQRLREARKQSAQNQLALKMQEAEVAYKKAQAMAQLTKAKAKNVEATIAAQAPPEIPPGVDSRITDEEVATKQTERQAQEDENRRKEEAHQAKIAIETTKTAHDIANKGKLAAAGVEAKRAAIKRKAKKK